MINRDEITETIEDADILGNTIELNSDLAPFLIAKAQALALVRIGDLLEKYIAIVEHEHGTDFMDEVAQRVKQNIERCHPIQAAFDRGNEV